MKYAWITEHCDSYPVAVMCEVLCVSTSGYYGWLDRAASPRAERHERIQQAVRQAHAESHGIYGSHKIAEVLAQRDDHRHHLPADGHGLGVPGGGDRFVQSQGGGLVARARRWLRSWRAWRCVGPSSRVALKAAGSCTIPIAAVSTPATPISRRCEPWASSVP